MSSECADIGVSLLGRVSARLGGQSLPLGTPMQRTVFAVLAAHANRTVVRDDLVEAVWGPCAPETAINSVYTYVARLRRIFEPGRSLGDRSKLLVSDGTGYAVHIPATRIDRQRFESHLAVARGRHRDGDADAAIQQYDAALALWDGAAYAGLSGPFVDADRARLDDLRFTAEQDRIEVLQNLGRHSGLVPTLSALVRQHPRHERLRFLLIRGYVQQGRQADAIGEYHDLRQQLAESQGIEPGERVQQLFEEVLRRAPTTDGAAAESRFPYERRTAPAQLARDVPGFTGYGAELAHLRSTAAGASASRAGAVVHITGGPGVGKSAVAVHLAHQVAADFPDGQLQIDLQGFGGRRPPLSPSAALRLLLTTLGADVPAGAGLAEQVALYRSVVAGKRLLILLDDAVSAEQVRPLLPATGSTLVISTSRNALTGLVARDGAFSVRLGGLREDEACAVFAQLLGAPVPEAEVPHVRRLVRACDGNPLAVRIAATRVRATGGLGAISRLADDCLIDQLDLVADEHSSLRTVFTSSMRALSALAARTFWVLGALPGPTWHVKTIEAVLGVEREAARAAVDELIDASLLQEPVPGHLRMDRLTHAYAVWLEHGVEGDLAAAR